MTIYTKTTDFQSKDALASGNPLKIVKGTELDDEFDAIAAADATNLKKDGTVTATGNIPMGTFKLTGLGSGSAKTDSANLGQTQDGVTKHLSGVSGVDTITATASPTLTAYTAGNKFSFVSAGANTGAVTINIDSLGAKSITKNGTTALVAGDIPSGAFVEIGYDGTRFQLGNLAAYNATNVIGTIASATTATTQSAGDNSTKVATTAYVDTATSSLPASAGASLVLIQSQAASSSATIDFTTGISSTYDEYELHFNKIVTATNDVALYLRVSEDGGSTFKSGASDYTYGINILQAGTNNPSETTTSQISFASGVSNTASEGGCSGVVKIYAPSSAVGKKIFKLDSSNWRPATGLINLQGTARYISTNNAINALRVLASSGNITSGNLLLYGVKKS